jgi:hypothetical protein
MHAMLHMLIANEYPAVNLAQYGILGTVHSHVISFARKHAIDFLYVSFDNTDIHLSLWRGVQKSDL